MSDPEACTPANTKPELLHLHKLLLEAGHLWNGAEACALDVEVMCLNDTG